MFLKKVVSFLPCQSRSVKKQPSKMWSMVVCAKPMVVGAKRGKQKTVFPHSLFLFLLPYLYQGYVLILYFFSCFRIYIRLYFQYIKQQFQLFVLSFFGATLYLFLSRYSFLLFIIRAAALCYNYQRHCSFNVIIIRAIAAVML